MGDLNFLSNFSEHVPFHSYWIIISSVPVIQIILHIKLTLLACMYSSGLCPLLFHFPLPVLFVVSKFLWCLFFCLVLSRLTKFDILFCYKFCSLNVMKSHALGQE